MDRALMKGGFVIDAGEQGGARNPTHVFAVEIGESQAAGCQPIQVRRFDLSAKAAQIGETHVVRHDQQDIGAFYRLRANGLWAVYQQKQNHTDRCGALPEGARLLTQG
jgi:hypothetical protein